MSDGRFSSKPIRAAQRRDFARGEFSAEAMTSPDAARALLMSPAVRREVNALQEEPFPEVGELKCAPFPRNTQTAAMELGRPIASAVLAQEYLIGLVFLRICGWLFILVGGLLLLAGVFGVVNVLSAPPREKMPANAILGLVSGLVIGMLVMGAGSWFGIYRGRIINQMCWFCPNGMVWRTESVFEWYGWEEVPEVYCKLSESRPAVGIGFGAPVSWISFSNTVASRRIVPYLENRASAANIERAMRGIAEGRSIRFGNWGLRKSGINRAAEEVDWRNVFEIERDDRDLVIRYGERNTLTIPLDEIPFPSMFTALARAMHAHARERPA
jgi:hypothetical protein